MWLIKRQADTPESRERLRRSLNMAAATLPVIYRTIKDAQVYDEQGNEVVCDERARNRMWFSSGGAAVPL